VFLCLIDVNFGLAIFCDNVFSDRLKFLVDFLNLHNTRLRPNVNYVEIVLGWQKPVLHPNGMGFTHPIKGYGGEFFFFTLESHSFGQLGKGITQTRFAY